MKVCFRSVRDLFEFCVALWATGALGGIGVTGSVGGGCASLGYPTFVCYNWHRDSGVLPVPAAMIGFRSNRWACRRAVFAVAVDIINT